jgi:hypothetical protein
VAALTLATGLAPAAAMPQAPVPPESETARLETIEDLSE